LLLTVGAVSAVTWGRRTWKSWKPRYFLSCEGAVKRCASANRSQSVEKAEGSRTVFV
jgi:hypothetical protein